MAKPLISAVINIHNEGDVLARCLRSLKNFAEEVIVVDMESTDNGRQIAADFGAKIYSYRHQRVVELARNFALAKATGKWIILLDPDEYLTRSLKNELLAVTKRNDVDFVKIPRKNLIFGRWLRHSNCWPDYLIRFFRRGTVSWQKAVHSQPLTRGNGLTLLDSEKLAIRHHNYENVNQYLIRTIRYSQVQADELKENDYKLKTQDFLLRPIQEFNSRFFAAEGFKDGLHGLIFAILQSFSISLIYIRLWEKQGSPDKALAKESFVSASQETVYEYSYWFTRYFVEDYTRNVIKISLIKIRHLLDRMTKNF